MAQRPSEISSLVKPVSCPSSHGAPIYKGYLRVGRNVHAVSWEQAGNHRSRHQGLSPQHSLTQVTHEGFFGADLGLCKAPAHPPWNGHPPRGAAIARRHHAQGLRHNSSPPPTGHGICKNKDTRRFPGKSLSRATRARTDRASHRRVAAPQASSSPSKVKLSASHHCQAPTNRGFGGIPPPQAQRQVPQPLLAAESPSASLFLCFAISKGERLCQDLNLLYHSPYALQHACRCLACLSSPASIPPRYPQRAEVSSQISHPDLDPFSKVSPPAPSKGEVFSPNPQTLFICLLWVQCQLMPHSHSTSFCSCCCLLTSSVPTFSSTATLTSTISPVQQDCSKAFSCPPSLGSRTHCQAGQSGQQGLETSPGFPLSHRKPAKPTQWTQFSHFLSCSSSGNCI